jgi:hypothetical protein
MSLPREQSGCTATPADVQAPVRRRESFHLLVWKDGNTRVFSNVKDGHGHGDVHRPEFNGQWSLWMALRIWWAMR